MVFNLYRTCAARFIASYYSRVDATSLSSIIMELSSIRDRKIREFNLLANINDVRFSHSVHAEIKKMYYAKSENIFF